MESLEGKVAFITGGGRGLGECICRVLAEAGSHVVCADIRETSADKVISSMNGSAHRCLSVQLDVADERSVENAVKATVAKFGRIDILVNNAAIDVALPVEDLSVRQWDTVLNVNLRGPFLASKSVFGLMKTNRSGHIVNITSTAARRAWANASAYHASKWGLLGLSHALHVEARQFNIKVTAVLSGGMKTPLLLERFPDTDVEQLQEPADVAQTVKFILTQPRETVIPEILVVPMRESSWP